MFCFCGSFYWFWSWFFIFWSLCCWFFSCCWGFYLICIWICLIYMFCSGCSGSSGSSGCSPRNFRTGGIYRSSMIRTLLPWFFRKLPKVVAVILAWLFRVVLVSPVYLRTLGIYLKIREIFTCYDFDLESLSTGTQSKSVREKV